MYEVHATGKWLRKDITRTARNVDAAESIMKKCVALRYPQVYIRHVGEDEIPTHVTPPLTVSAISRDRRLTTRIILGTATQKVINIRLGSQLLKMVSHCSEDRNQSQNAFILDAIRYGLDNRLSDTSVTLSDWGAVTADKVQYSIRLEGRLLKQVDESATKCNCARSHWVIWALLRFMENLPSGA